VYTDMDNWAEIRRRDLADGLSGRAACREYKIHWKTLRKILDFLLPVIHQIIEDDKKAPRRQRHTAKRIFDRLRAEHGYAGGLTTIKDAVRAWRRRTAEVFVPLSHPPGQARPTSATPRSSSMARPPPSRGWIPEKSYAAIASCPSEGCICGVGGLISTPEFNSATMSGASHRQARRRSSAIAAWTRSIASSHRPVNAAARSTSIASAFPARQ